MHQYTVQLTSWQKRTGGILMDTKGNMRQQCTLATKKASSILSCIRKSVVSRSKVAILSFSSALVRPDLESQVQVQAPQYKRDRHTGASLVKGHKADEGHGAYKERLRKPCLFSPEKRRLRGHLINAYKYLMGECKDGASLLGGSQ